MKKCKFCEKLREDNDFYKKAGNRCKECSKKQTNKWRKEHPIQVKEIKKKSDKKYYTKNKDKIISKISNWCRKNRIKSNSYKQKYDKNNPQVKRKSSFKYKSTARKLLTDYHIKSILHKRYKLNTKSITSDFIESFRMEIKVKQLLKQKKNGREKESTHAS